MIPIIPEISSHGSGIKFEITVALKWISIPKYQYQYQYQKYNIIYYIISSEVDNKLSDEIMLVGEKGRQGEATIWVIGKSINKCGLLHDLLGGATKWQQKKPKMQPNFTKKKPSTFIWRNCWLDDKIIMKKKRDLEHEATKKKYSEELELELKLTWLDLICWIFGSWVKKRKKREEKGGKGRKRNNGNKLNFK